MTEIVPSELRFELRNYEGDPSLCTSGVFVLWDDRFDTQASAWTVSWTWSDNKVESKDVEPPFDDELVFNSGGALGRFEAPAGSHWVGASFSGKDAPDSLVADCSDQLANYREAVVSSSVQITYCPSK